MEDLLAFLDAAHSTYHVTEHIRRALEGQGYTGLQEGRDWSIVPGGKYYVVRDGSAFAAFRVPKEGFRGFMLSISHGDSPTFRVAEKGASRNPDGYVRVHTERYGGMLCAPWLDRPLTVAGRVLVRTEKGLETRLVYVDRNLMLIPNVAIHMNRTANEGTKYDPKCDTVPLLGLEQGDFWGIVAEAAGCAAEDILGHDLFLRLREKACVWGINNEFIAAPRLDDLQCVYGCLRGFLEAGESESVPVLCLIDREEVGSNSPEGAAGTFLPDVLERICRCLGRDERTALANSFLVSADNAHAVHPNHPEYADAAHRPVMNGGVVIKRGIRYATDGVSQALFATLCRRAGVPVQHFINRPDLPGGGTVGNIMSTHLPTHSVDVGLAQLAMHSCYETAGAKDTDYLIAAMTAFYSASFREENGSFTL